MASSRCWSWVSELTIAAPVPVAAMPDAARTLGGTPVAEIPAEGGVGGSEAAPPPPPAETVGVEPAVPRGRSEPYAARLPAAGGGPAIIGAGVPEDAAALAAVECPATGALGAAGGRAEPEADAGVTLAAAGGGAELWGTDGGSGLAAPEARPLVNPCDKSWAAVVGVGRLAGAVGVEGVLGVLDMVGVLVMDGIDGGFIPPPAPIPDIGEAGLIGGTIAPPPPGCCTAGAGVPPSIGLRSTRTTCPSPGPTSETPPLAGSPGLVSPRVWPCPLCFRGCVVWFC